MKTLALILSVIMSLFCGGNTKGEADISVSEDQCSISESTSSGDSVDYTLFGDICLTSPHGYSFSGHNSINPISGRRFSSGRRLSWQTKSTSRIVKSGKIINNSNLHPFLAHSFSIASGQLSSERYLYSICRIRL